MGLKFNPFTGTFDITGSGSATPDTLVTKNIIGANTTITAGYSSYIPQFVEIVDTFTLEIGLASFLEIG